MTDTIEERLKTSPRPASESKGSGIYPIDLFVEQEFRTSIKSLPAPIASKIPLWIKILGSIWCIILIVNGVFSFLVNHYIAQDSGNREAYFEGSNRNMTIGEGLRIRVMLIDLLSVDKVPMIYTDDRGWYKRIYLGLKEDDVDKIKLKDLNGYRYLIITAYATCVIWIVIGLFDLYKFRTKKGLVSAISYFLQGAALVLQMTAYQMVIRDYLKFEDYYGHLFEGCHCPEFEDNLKESARKYIIYTIFCLAIALIHFFISLCHTIKLIKNH